MSTLQRIRTAASQLAGPDTATNVEGDTRLRQQRSRGQTLTHVHSYHLDDQSLYQDQLHDYESDSDTESSVDDVKVKGEDGTAQVKSQEGDDLGGWQPESAANEVTGAALADLEKALSRKSARTTRSRRDNDPNMVSWDGPNDPENPKNWKKITKWQATFVVSCFTFISPVSSSMIAPATPQMLVQFGVTSTVLGQMMLSVFVLAYAVGPLFLAPMSEMYGRVRVLQLANLFFLVFNTACGASTSAGMMIAFRFLSGLGGSAPLAVGGGVLSDIWSAEERGSAIAIYSLMPLLGPALGPIIGGYISQRLGDGGWRWIFYAVSIADAVIQIGGLFALKETYPPLLLKRKLQKIRKETGNNDLFTEYDDRTHTHKQIFGIALLRPFRMLFTQPIIQFMALYMAFLYGVMYLLLSTFSQLFTQAYHEDVGTSGLNYIALAVGFAIGSQISARAQDKCYRYMSAKNDGKGKPEFRTIPMFPGTILTPIGLFIYGWSAQYRTHWIVPNIGAAIFSAGVIVCFQGIQTYMVDAYTRYAASALSAVTLLRSCAGFGFPLFAPAMYAALDYGWGNSLLGFAAIVIGIPAPFVLWKFGESLRAKSTFAAG